MLKYTELKFYVSIQVIEHCNLQWMVT